MFFLIKDSERGCTNLTKKGPPHSVSIKSKAIPNGLIFLIPHPLIYFYQVAIIISENQYEVTFRPVFN